MSRQFGIFTFENSKQIHDFHLRQNLGNFELQCLGKNGEAKPEMNVSLQFEHKDIGIVNKELTSDSNGKLYLGKLKGVLRLIAKNNGSYLGTRLSEGQREWQLPGGDVWCYPAAVDCVVGGQVEIPVASMWLNGDSLRRE